MNDKPYPYNEDQLAWLHDLETTEEPQTEGYLHRIFVGDLHGPGYCCLGRACVVLSYDETERHGHGYFNGYDRLLPHSAKKRLRLRSNNGELEVSFESEDDDETFEALTTMNDAGWSFKKIAAYIRANPWNVFLDPEDAA